MASKSGGSRKNSPIGGMAVGNGKAVPAGAAKGRKPAVGAKKAPSNLPATGTKIRSGGKGASKTGTAGFAKPSPAAVKSIKAGRPSGF